MIKETKLVVNKRDCPHDIWLWLSQGFPSGTDPVVITSPDLARSYQERWREFAARTADLRKIRLTPPLVMAEACRREGEWFYFVDKAGHTHAAYCREHRGDSHAPGRAVGAVRIGQTWFWVLVDE